VALSAQEAASASRGSEMDLPAVVGMVLNIGMVCLAIRMGHATVSSMLDEHAGLVVVGGTILAMITTYRAAQLKSLGKVLGRAFFYPIPSPEKEIERLVGYATLARREGLLSIEEKLEEVTDEFEARGLRMVVDGLPAEEIRKVLETEINYQLERHQTGKKMVERGSEMAPAFGMLATLMGLVAMLRNMSDPSGIGTGMALALIATFYGSFVANVICLPIAGKLGEHGKEEAMVRMLILEGVLAIQAGDKPQLVEEKLKTFLSPKERVHIGGKKEAAAATAAAA
jgi:chemotaxis protein MotA